MNERRIILPVLSAAHIVNSPVVVLSVTPVPSRPVYSGHVSSLSHCSVILCLAFIVGSLLFCLCVSGPSTPSYVITCSTLMCHTWFQLSFPPCCLYNSQHRMSWPDCHVHARSAFQQPTLCQLWKNPPWTVAWFCLQTAHPCAFALPSSAPQLVALRGQRYCSLFNFWRHIW